MDFILSPVSLVCTSPAPNLSFKSIFLVSRRGYTCNLVERNCHLIRVWKFRCVYLFGFGQA